MAAQSEKSFPFDAELINGNYDRQYLADDFARYFRAFISSGVFLKESTNLQVIANGDMSVTLKPGKAIIEGYRYENDSDLVLDLSPADGVLNRIDRIAITWSKEDRDIHCSVREGTASYEPTAPGCRRTADYIDYVVADVMISAGAITINQSDITDQRLNSEICGLAIAFSEIDTTTIFNQFTEWYKETKEAGEEEIEKMLDDYTAWLANLEEEQRQECEQLVEEMKDLLDEAAAAALQLQIDELKQEVELNYFGLKAVKTTFNPDGSITEIIGTNMTRETTFGKSEQGDTITEAIYEVVIDESGNIGSKEIKYIKVTTMYGNVVEEKIFDRFGGEI